ncbi:MAG: endonuclease/exonuclease/phosphatase family protein [Ornithinimicrobium sp.]
MRTVVGVVGWMWWLAAAGLFALRWVDGGVLVVALQCGIPLVGASLGLLLMITSTARLWLLSALTAALLVPLTVLTWPWFLQPDLHEPGDDDTVVMSSNLLFGLGDIDAINKAVIRRDVDALVLLEITPEALAQVEASDIPRLLPHRSGEPRIDAGGTMVFTRQSHALVPGAPSLIYDQVVVRVQPESPQGRSWLLFGAHPVPPTQATWSEELGALRDWQRARPEQTPLVMAGDFNASTAHPPYRGLQEGLTDTRRRTAPGWVRTWPREYSVPAFVQLDHVLVRGWDVVDAGQVRVPGSDHDAVWARVATAGG